MNTVKVTQDLTTAKNSIINAKVHLLKSRKIEYKGCIEALESIQKLIDFTSYNIEVIDYNTKF